MPRSYGFDHFTVPKTSQPQPPRGKKPLERSPRGGKRKAAPPPPGQARPHPDADRRLTFRDTWTYAGEQARGIREGAEQVLRAGRELVRLPVDLLRALRAAAHEG